MAKRIHNTWTDEQLQFMIEQKESGQNDEEEIVELMFREFGVRRSPGSIRTRWSKLQNSERYNNPNWFDNVISFGKGNTAPTTIVESKPPRHKMYWSQREERYIMENCGKQTIKEIAKALSLIHI